MSNTIDHPEHYTSRDIGYECIDLAQYQTFCVGNAIKYLWRYKDKEKPIEDLRKARWYAARSSVMQETVDNKAGYCKTILLRLTDSTSGYECAAWLGLLWSKWYIVLSALDMLIEEAKNDTQDV